MESSLKVELSSNTYPEQVDSKEKPQRFGALKQLKDTEMHYDVLCNRIRVIHANQQKNVNRIKKSHEQFHKIIQIRQSNKRDIQHMKNLRNSKNSHVEEQKKKNQSLKETIESRIRQNIQQIAMKRVQNRDQIKQMSEKFEKSISFQKEENLQEKQRKRSQVALNEVRSHENVKQFLHNRQTSLHKSKKKEVEVILKKRQKKNLQIQNLSQIEMGMLQKYSQSQIAYKQMKNKLDGMLGRIRQDKKEKQMPSFHDENSKKNLH